MNLHSLKPAKGSTKTSKRLGRGEGSGSGGTASKGHNGAQSRSGYSRKIGFEGGQMPLKRRIPKRGFTPLNRTEYNEVKVSDLSRIAGENVDPAEIRKAHIVKGRGPIVLLGTGDIDRAVKISVHRVTKSAQEKITAAGGSIEILPLDPIDRRVKKGPTTRNKKSKVPSIG